MLATTLTSKGQATIPAEVRKILHLHPGDKITFAIEDHKIIIGKLERKDRKYYEALSNNLSEWSSPEDDEDYRNL